jgi:hypothetical protein
MTKDTEGILIPPGDTAQRYRANKVSGGALGNEDMEYNNTGTGDGGPASMIDDEDD